MAKLSHPDIPFEFDYIGQEVVCRYPSGSTSIASRSEYLATLILVKLDKLIENRASTPITEGLVLDQVLEIVDKEVCKLAPEEPSEAESKKKGVK